jgi:IS5 family transposase
MKMPRRYPPEIRRQVVELARAGTRVAQLATTFGMSEPMIYTWLKQEQIDRGEIEGLSARGRGAQAKLQAAAKLEELAGRARKVAEQIDRRTRGLKITGRLVSLADPDVRPIRKGKLSKPTEFGYVAQICEITENTRKGARGFILPAAHEPGNPAENRLRPHTAAQLDRAEIRPREIIGDGGFLPGPTKEAFPELTNEQIQLSGRHEPGSRRTRKRRARYRTGIEGRISHLKRSYGLRRSRLKGDDGMKTWTGWAILAYDLDTLAIRTD